MRFTRRIAVRLLLESEIVFGRSEYNPGLSAGLNLLAHELAHVVQQGYATPMRQDWREKEEAQQAQTVAPSGRFAAFQIASLANRVKYTESPKKESRK